MKRWGGKETSSISTASRCNSGLRVSELWHSGGDFVSADGFHPFGGDGIPFFHGHARIGVKHLRPTTAAPREEVEEMIFADGPCTGRGVGVR